MQESTQSEFYYYITLAALGNHVSVETMSTLWEAWTDESRRIEVRKASRAGEPKYWAVLKENWVWVNNVQHLLLLLRFGGHALIARELVEMWWPDFLDSVSCRQYGGSPFVGEDYLPPGAEDRFPAPLVRKRVFARDEYKCGVCGQSPNDNSSVRLEMHHIVEHSLGGRSVEHNLITLCMSCHENASPPDPWLRADLFNKVLIAAADYHRRGHAQGVEGYRDIVGRMFLRDKNVAWPDASWPDPLEHLGAEDIKLEAIEAKRSVYRLLCANTVVRFYGLSEWKRIVRRALNLVGK